MITDKFLNGGKIAVKKQPIGDFQVDHIIVLYFDVSSASLELGQATGYIFEDVLVHEVSNTFNIRNCG